jgi:hypothetical protein
MKRSIELMAVERTLASAEVFPREEAGTRKDRSDEREIMA